MDPALVTLENHRAGDTWQGIPTIGPILISVDDAPAASPSAPLASARLHLTRNGDSEPTLKIGMDPADDAPLLIVDAATWEMSIPEVSKSVFNPVPGIYTGDLETTDSDGRVLTTHHIEFQVTKDGTR